MIITKIGNQIDLSYLDKKLREKPVASYSYLRARRDNENSPWTISIFLEEGATQEDIDAVSEVYSNSINETLQEGQVKEMFFPPSKAQQSIGSFLVNSINKNGTTYFTFHCPNDLLSISSIKVFCVPLFNKTGNSFELSSTYGSIGQEYNQFEEIENVEFDFQKNILTEVDVTSLFDNAVANTMAGLKIKHNNIGGTIRYVGLEIRYYARI